MTIRIDASRLTFLPLCDQCPGWREIPSLTDARAWAVGLDHQRRVHGADEAKADAERQAARHR